MEIVIPRLLDDGKSTVGKLYVDGRLFCGSLEDTRRHEKIAGISRIKAGRYPVKMREGTPKASHYEHKYGTKGMIWLQGVPDFDWIYIHIGNDADDSQGCILVGWFIQLDCQEDKMRLVSSTECYKQLHALVVKALQAGESVFVTIIDN